MFKKLNIGSYDASLRIKYVFPIILDSLFVVILGMLIAQVNSSISKSALAAISFSNTLQTIFIGAFAIFNSGAAILVSREVGAGELQKAKENAFQTVVFNIIFSLLMVTVLEVFAEPLFRLLMPTADEIMFEEAIRYFRLLMVSFVFYTTYNVLLTSARAMGEATMPMIASVSMNLLALVFCYLFITVFDLKEIGAGLGYLVARVIGVAIAAFGMFRKGKYYSLSFRFLKKLQFNVLKTLTKVAVFCSLESISVQIGYMLSSTYSVALTTEEASAYSIISTVSAFGTLASSILNPISLNANGHLLGAKRFDRAKRATYFLLVVGLLLGFATNITLTVFATPLAKIYSQDATTISLVHDNMWVLILVNIFAIIINVTSPKLSAAGDNRFIFMTSMIGVWVFKIPLTILFTNVFSLGVLGLFLANGVTLIVRAFILSFRLAGKKWFHEVD